MADSLRRMGSVLPHCNTELAPDPRARTGLPMPAPRASHLSPTTQMYIDPAAGSLVLQVMIAGVLAVTTSVKSARQSVMRQFRRLFGSRKEE
jgi:hypothetical protein